eukprot:maker-scaffold527_size145964-snap-gene-0.19 protein:Tk02380 transcript:maker-scaffold527_size145964-snap-gene-0.19-mRNA-1 annotation:"GH22067"
MLSTLTGITSRNIRFSGIGLKKMPNSKVPIRKKIVFVGDGATGKTSLHVAFSQDIFDPHYQITVFENFCLDYELDGVPYELVVWDTAGQEDYEQLRPLSYPETDVIVLCFAVDSQDSLDNLRDKWLPELEHYLPGVPIVVVGNKIDLRTDLETLVNMSKLRQKCVVPMEGRAMAEIVGAKDYVECSSKTFKGINSVFETTVRVATAFPVEPPKVPLLHQLCSCFRI